MARGAAILHAPSSALLSVLLPLVHLGSAVDVGFEGMFRSSPEEVMTPVCANARSLPKSLRGTYLTGGPALFEFGGEAFQGVMDGFGKMNKFEFRDGSVCYASAMLRSAVYNQSVSQGHIAPGVLFKETVPPRHCPMYDPLCNLVDGNADNNWVNSAALPGGKDGEVLLFSDTTTIMNFDVQKMTTSGTHKFTDNFPRPFHLSKLASAHPHPEGSGGFIEIAIAEGVQNFVDLFRVSPTAADQRKLIASYEASTAPYMHSFGLTANFAVFPHNLQFDLTAMMKTFGGTMEKAIKPDSGVVKVVNLTDGKVFDFRPKPFFHVHVVNAFENATGVVFDVCAWDVMPFAGPSVLLSGVRSKAARDTSPGRGGTRRYHFQLAGDGAGTVTEEVLTVPTRSVDFPRIDPRLEGQPYCVYYATEWFHDDATYGSMAVLRHDICKSEKTYWYRENWYPSEAVFVPTGDAEADGVLLFVALDGLQQTSHLVVLDARTMEVAEEIPVPVRIPFLGHGEFFPSARADALGGAPAVEPETVLV